MTERLIQSPRHSAGSHDGEGKDLGHQNIIAEWGRVVPPRGVDPAPLAGFFEGPRLGLHGFAQIGAIIDPPEEYLPVLRELCDRHNVLLIFDEIITGVGRTGNMFAAETFGVTPDVLCIGKGLGGGYAPLSAMICRRSIADAEPFIRIRNDRTQRLRISFCRPLGL